MLVAAAAGAVAATAVTVLIGGAATVVASPGTPTTQPACVNRYTGFIRAVVGYPSTGCTSWETPLDLGGAALLGVYTTQSDTVPPNTVAVATATCDDNGASPDDIAINGWGFVDGDGANDTTIAGLASGTNAWQSGPIVSDRSLTTTVVCLDLPPAH